MVHVSDCSDVDVRFFPLEFATCRAHGEGAAGGLGKGGGWGGE